MANYKVILLDDSEHTFDNIASVDWTDRTVSAIEAETRDIAFMYPITQIKSVTKILD